MSLFIEPPHMNHGDAQRQAEFMETWGMPLVPWQVAFLERLEAASIDKQFSDIVKADREAER